MNKPLKIILLTVSIFFSMNVFAMKLSLRDKAFKEKYLKELKHRRGYLGHKSWDNFVVMAAKYQDKDILNKMLSIKQDEGPQFVIYLSDLFNVFKKDQSFFIKTAYEFYGKDMFCLVSIFKTAPVTLPLDEIEGSFLIKTTDKLLMKFYSNFKKELLPVGKKRLEKQLKCNSFKNKI